MNFQTQFFISGKFGKKEIAREDINSLVTSLKDIEWTNNTLYKPGKAIDVRPTFNPKTYSIGAPFQSKNVNFDSLLIEIDPHLDEFNTYEKECEKKRMKWQDEVEARRLEFIDTFFQSEAIIFDNDTDMKILNEKIKGNKWKILLSDQNMKMKLDKYMGYMTSSSDSGKEFTLLGNFNMINSDTNTKNINSNINSNTNTNFNPNTNQMFSNQHFSQVNYNQTGGFHNVNPTGYTNFTQFGTTNYVQPNTTTTTYVQPNTTTTNYVQPNTTTTTYVQPNTTTTTYVQPNTTTTTYVQPNNFSPYTQNTNLYANNTNQGFYNPQLNFTGTGTQNQPFNYNVQLQPNTTTTTTTYNVNQPKNQNQYGGYQFK